MLHKSWVCARVVTLASSSQRASLRLFSSLARLNFKSSFAARDTISVTDESAVRGDATKENLAVPSTEITLPQFLNDDRFHGCLKKSVKDLLFTEFTPVQQRAILPFISEEGVVCKAKTGTGKTLSFVIPLLNRCLDDMETKAKPGIKGLIIAPTRDLARQIYEDILKLTNSHSKMKRNIKTELWCGGTQSMRPRGKNFGPPQIVVGTPGRILDNLNRNSRPFASLEYRVFDEADRLLDQGFEQELVSIDEALQAAREPTIGPLKNTLFSATVDDTVINFAKSQIQEDFKYINCVQENETEAHKAIEQELVHTESLHDSVSAAIDHVVEKKASSKYKGVFFLPTKVIVENVFNIVRDLSSSKGVWRLHGDMSQAKRDRTTADFKKASQGILICTDVAARGMDFKNITEVVQIGVSRDTADYVHKIGRTGRAGALGQAKLYLSSPEMPFARRLNKDLGIEFSTTTKIEPEEVKLIFERTSVHPDDAEEVAMSMLGAQKAVADAFRLDKFLMIKDLVDLYRSMLNDPSAKLYMTAKKFNMIGLPTSLVPDHVEVDDERQLKQKGPGRRDMRRQFERNTRGGNFQHYGRNSYSSYSSRRNDRFSSYRDGNDGRNNRSQADSLQDLDSHYRHGHRSKRSFR